MQGWRRMLSQTTLSCVADTIQDLPIHETYEVANLEGFTRYLTGLTAYTSYGEGWHFHVDTFQITPFLLIMRASGRHPFSQLIRRGMHEG